MSRSGDDPCRPLARPALSGDVLVSIPVFNEERYVRRVLGQVRRYARDVLVVDDGSTDGTDTLLRGMDWIYRITHAENRGYGKSLSDAFEFARRRGYRWLITMDCDEQHEPACIPRFLELAERGGVDLISGTRYPEGPVNDRSVPADRQFINQVITRELNHRLGLNITDAFCGFKAYRVESLSQLRITVPGYAVPMQFWVQAARARLRMVELPVRLIYHDPTRHFGGLLDNPAVRLDHYRSVLESELAIPWPFPATEIETLSCQPVD